MDVVEIMSASIIEKRSATLDGSIPLRAAQGCKPLLDGNAAGFHVRLRDPAVIRVGKKGPFLQLTDEGYAKITEDYSSKIERLVDQGILIRNGYWHKTLEKGFVWKKNNSLFLWTGRLVRPDPGVWILVSGAFNRRCLIDLTEHVITDDQAFTPLVLQLDLSSLRERVTWLDTELACLTPLKPDAGFNITSIRQEPQVGKFFCDFYDQGYLENPGDGKYIGRYRKHTAAELSTESDKKAECKLVVAGGPNLHQIRTFERFATAEGFSRNNSAKNRLQFAVVRNICEVRGRWDGSLVRDLVADMPDEVRHMREVWSELYGVEVLSSIEWFLEYALPHLGRHRAEPFLTILPWVFATTPPGWSSIVDGFPIAGLDGMRGVVSTDSFFDIPHLWQLRKPGRLKVRRGARLARVLPVPRRLLLSTFRELDLDTAAATPRR